MVIWLTPSLSTVHVVYGCPFSKLSNHNRYEVVDVDNEEPEYIEDQEEDSTENIIIIQEEQQFEPQKVTAVKETTNENSKNNEETPIIVYPEGTPGQPDYSPDPPAPVFPSQNPNPNIPYPPRRPPPPQFNRRPPRPQPNNFRRPPPPPQRQPPPKYLPALSRNAPPPPQEQRPRPPPPPRQSRPGPPPRPRPPPPQGILGGIVNNLKCKVIETGGDIRLQDENFVRQQLDCVLDQGPCDELGSTLKRKFIINRNAKVHFYKKGAKKPWLHEICPTDR